MNNALLKKVQYEPVQAATNSSGEKKYDAPIFILGKIVKKTVRNWKNPLEKATVQNTLYTNATVKKDSRVRNPGDTKGYIIKQELDAGEYVLE